MSNNLLQFSLVVIATDHNPTILNPDFLRLQNIVPTNWGWELASPPITTPPLATIQYESGVSISVESNKLQVVDDKATTPSESKIVAMVNRYVEAVPHVRYTAVGINFRSAIKLDNADEYLKEQFLKKGPWDSKENQMKSVGLRFVYPATLGRLVMSIDSGIIEEVVGNQVQKKPVIIANANFHRDLDVTKLPTSKQVPNYLKEIQADWDRFSELLVDMLPTSNNEKTSR